MVVIADNRTLDRFRLGAILLVRNPYKTFRWIPYVYVSFFAADDISWNDRFIVSIGTFIIFLLPLAR